MKYLETKDKIIECALLKRFSIFTELSWVY